MDECDAIAAIDGVDLLFIGPSDLSQSLGCTGDFWNPKCLSAIAKVAEACQKHGKHWGAVCANPDHAEMMYEQGCRLLSPTSDTRIINAGVQAVKQVYSHYFGAK